MTDTLRSRLMTIPLLGLVITVFTLDKHSLHNCGTMLFSYGITTLITAFLWIGNIYIFNFLHQKYPSLDQTVVRTGLVVALCVCYTLSTYTLLQFSLSVYFQQPFIWQGYVVGLKIAFIATTIVTLLFEAHFFFQQWKRVAIDVEKLKRESLQAQLESLRNQVNPHFLFNSLNTLITIIPEDPALAMDFTQKLSQVYRYLLSTREKELVSIETEMDFILAYLFLLKVRFENGIEMKIDIRERFKNFKIPPVSIQLLVENAIKHNIVSKDHPLRIEIKAEEEFLIVINNLQPKIQKEESTGVGLENIRKRYLILAERKIEIRKTDNYFEVKLPLLKIVV